MAATTRDGHQGRLRRLWACLGRQEFPTAAASTGSPDEEVDVPSDELPDDRSSTLTLSLVLSVGVGILLSVLRSPFEDAGFPLRWPPAALGTSEAVAAQGVLTAVVLGAVLEGRGAADRITSLRREGPAALRVEEPSLVRRYVKATGLSGGVASFAAIIGTSSVVTLFVENVFASVVVALMSLLVVSLSSFVTTTSQEARVALRRENDRLRRREVRALRIAEAYWTSQHRPPRPHGARRAAASLVPLSGGLALVGLWALLSQRDPAFGFLLLSVSVVVPLVAVVTVRVVIAGALQKVSERTGPWLAFVPIWLLVLLVATFTTAVLGRSSWWLLIAGAALLLVHVTAVTWVLAGLFWQRGTFRHLRPGVASRVAARAEEIEAPDKEEAQHRSRRRLVREWRAMSGRDAPDEAVGADS